MIHAAGSLNPEQREAVEHFEGPSLVLAGAGSGKTRVLTTRVCHLIMEHGVPPDRIMAVTFTNKAAGEMRERVAAMLGGEPRGIWMGTFHAIGVRLLRRHAPEVGWTRGFAIRDAEQALREVKKAQKAADVDPKRWSPKAVRAAISDAKNYLIGPEEFAKAHADGPDLLLRKTARVYPVYQASLRDQDAMDFDDLLVLPVRLLENNQGLLQRYQEAFAFILVDEYQDTNRAQFRFLELLAGRHGNLMVVGDDDQSIYGWRGADIRNILDFERSFPGGAGREARAELPLDSRHPRRRQPGDPGKPVPQGQDAADGPGRRSCDHPAGSSRRDGRSPLDRGRDRAAHACGPVARPP